MNNTKTWLGFVFYTKDKLENPKRFKQVGLSWKSTEKTHSARDSIDRARPKCTVIAALARFQLYIKNITLSKTKHY